MNVKTKITLLFSIITASILFAFALIIYLNAAENRKNEFYSLLTKEALTKANLIFEANVKPKTLQNIYVNNRKILNEVEVAIYTEDFNLIYHDALEIDLLKETPEMLQEISTKDELKFTQNKFQVVGFKHLFNGQNYLITAIAFDEYGLKKQEKLAATLMVSFLFGIVIIYLLGRFLSIQVIKPIQKMAYEFKQITANNLDLRLSGYNTKDEIGQLATTFNAMLDRLEDSFESQKYFVSNISHELRTPLSAVITELELALTNEKDNDEYRNVIYNTLEDAKKLAKLSNSLLDLAKASYDKSKIKFSLVRIDEILIEAIQDVRKNQDHFSIHLNFKDEIENEKQISFYANPYLLKVAFINLIENACKYASNKTCWISINFTKSGIKLIFEDRGVGIEKEELKQIFNPFFRGANKTTSEGNGIGLYLTKKIADLHSAEIKVISKVKIGTKVIIELTSNKNIVFTSN